MQAAVDRRAPEIRDSDAATGDGPKLLPDCASSPNHRRVFLADSEWSIIVCSGSCGPDRADHAAWCAPGQQVSWTSLPGHPESASGSQRGRLETPEGSQLAVAHRLGDGSGTLVAYHPVADIDARVAALAPPLVGAAAVTLLWTCALLGITVYLAMAQFYDETSRERERSEAQALERMESLVRMRDAIIFGLAKLADSRDPETGDHLERMSLYATRLAATLQSHPQYRDAVTPAFVRLIGISSVLHDIGKVGVADAILLKPGPLSDDERSQMQKHAEVGGDCLLQIEQRLGSSNFLQMAREIALAHHERWDGTGYPSGLTGEEIPLAARIVAIADVYDALSSRRTYKEPFPHIRCVETIRNDAGKAFDPQLVEVWLTIESRFRDTARQYWPNTIDQADDDRADVTRLDEATEAEPALVGASDES